MTGKKTFSVSQFLEAQKGSESFSALLKACQALDVASLEEEEQVTLAKALRDVAKTKNGPMLILSLSGAWQAMLALVGMEMPGQDRLAFRGTLPRQVVGYLAKHPEGPLFAGYSFAQVGKGDWAYYLERAKELIEPCKRFLEKAEAEGGFAHGELVEIAKKTGLVDDDDFWDAYEERVVAFEEPSLGAAFVREFRKEFPIAFDKINADFMLAYAKANQFKDAKRHFVYMTETMRGSDDVNETEEEVFRPQVERLELQIKHCRDSEVAEDGLKDARAVLAASRELFQIFAFLLSPDNYMYRDLRNKVVQVAHRRLVQYANKTKDFEGVLLIERKLLNLAASSNAKNTIQKGIDQLEKIIQEERTAD